mmetsp:Transcript_26675/g.67850  ORF Transcript_26675/g.67850 Transcript_26675/m.67850 type:complete len:234 (-) Transcript_26675:372-1073(-)
MVAQHLLPDEMPKALLRRRLLFKVHLNLGRGQILLGRIAVRGEIRVRQRLRRRRPLLGIELQKPREKVEQLRVCLWIDFGEALGGGGRRGGCMLLGAQVSNVRHRLLIVDPVELLGRRHAQRFDDEPQLVQRVFAWEERLRAEQLGEDAADGPHVDLGVVHAVLHEQLGSAVPPRHHVLRQEVEAVRWVHTARQTEVGDLQITVLVHEQIGRLEVTVENVARVDVFEAAEQLV